MLEGKIKNVETVVQEYIRELGKQIRIERAILFGSYCRGNPKVYSDIDVAIFSPDFQGGTEEDYLLLDRTARRINTLLEAHPYHPKDIQDHESGDFLDEILKTGKVIYQKARF